MVGFKEKVLFLLENIAKAPASSPVFVENTEMLLHLLEEHIENPKIREHVLALREKILRIKDIKQRET